ncbi:MAG: hypothetical protein A2W80_05795 [Candidatus Riflebacteria bacterium GWC2_50_8]|nr:MAG: hypothetical protein A2W80_05795 [Candidatus Riflebacteria bacterium GWC2_50_8]
MTFKAVRTNLFHRIIGLVLMLTILGTSPGIFDTINLNAVHAATTSAATTPFSENKVDLDAANPLAVSTSDSGAQKTAIVADQSKIDELKAAEEAEKKKQMSKIEEIAWSVGKALLPTLAVMAFSAAVVCPLAWIVVGAVVVGAATSGIMTFAYETRKNSFRSESEKKSMDKIWREVSIQAAISGAMAPFNMLTAGMVQAVGPLTMKTIIQTAAKAGAVSFLGSTVSNVTKGAVTNLWYNNYYNYDEREKQLKTNIAALEAKTSRTQAEDLELAAALKELDTITKEKYTWDNFRKDEKKALVSAGISGVLGGIAGRYAAETDWAKKVSSKLFGTVSKANLVSNAVVSNPFAFATGAASAAVDKKEILNQIEYNRLQQVKYEKDSAAWGYYEQKISDLEEAYKSISLSEAGKQALIGNAAMQTAIVGTSLAKTRIWDLPSQKRAKVQQTYEEQSEEWKKVADVRQELELMKYRRPVASDYQTKSEYSQALREYVTELNSLRNDYSRAKIDAAAAQKTPDGQARMQEIEKKVTAEIEYNRQSELARALGRESYVEFKMKELEKSPENANLTPAELRAKASEAVANGYRETAKNSAIKLAQMEEKLDRQNANLTGKVERGDDGKLYVVVSDERGNEVMRQAYLSGDGSSLVSRIKGGTPAEMKEAEISNVVKQAYNQSAMVKPTSFRNEYVSMRVNQMRADGLTEQQIDSQLSGIVNEANSKMVQTYGSWQNVAKAEILAEGLARAKYEDGAAPNLGKILDFLKKGLSDRTISTVQNEISGGITGVVPKSIIKSDPLAPIFKTDERDEATLQRITDKAMRDYYLRNNENYR